MYFDIAIVTDNKFGISKGYSFLWETKLSQLKSTKTVFTHLFNDKYKNRILITDMDTYTYLVYSSDIIYDTIIVICKGKTYTDSQTRVSFVNTLDEALQLCPNNKVPIVIGNNTLLEHVFVSPHLRNVHMYTIRQYLKCDKMLLDKLKILTLQVLPREISENINYRIINIHSQRII